jgi:hypothetical protein
MYRLRTALYGIALLAAACGTSSSDFDEICLGSKCDDPGKTGRGECEAMCDDGADAECMTSCLETMALDHCEARKNDAIGSAQKAFLPNAIRWAASDVEGVNQVGGDDRGQEYVEYFAVVELPAEIEGGERGDSKILGKNIGSSVMNPETGQPLQPGETATIAKDDLEIIRSFTTPSSVDLTEDQVFYLEDHPDEIMGQCVFTSWHQDVPGPICNRESGCDDVLGHKLSDMITNVEPAALSQTKKAKRPRSTACSSVSTPTLQPPR